MDIAYDNVQHRIIFAEDIQRDESFRLRRYDFICPYCRKPVHFFNSQFQRPHFRHEHCTYAVDCELYARSYVTATKNEIFKERNIGVKLEWSDNLLSFYLTAKFDLEEIQQCETGQVSLKYWSIDEYGRKSAIKEYAISESVFVPDEMKMLSLINNKQVIYEYGNTNGEYSLWGSCVIYKVVESSLENNEIEAIFMTSKNLYVGHCYIILSNQKLDRYLHIKGISILKTDKVIEGVHAYLISIDKYSLDSQNIFAFYDYSICDKSEEITVLWPPMNSVYEEYTIKTDSLYVKSTVVLQPFKNTDTNVNNLGQNIYRLKSADKIKIIVNDDLMILGSSSSNKIENLLEIKRQEVGVGNIQVDGTGWFLINPLNPTSAVSSNIRLKDGDVLHRYVSNYLVEKIVTVKDTIEQGLGFIIEETLKYNKSLIKLEDRDLNYKGKDPSVIEYLAQCIRTGKINPKIREILGE